MRFKSPAAVTVLRNLTESRQRGPRSARCLAALSPTSPSVPTGCDGTDYPATSCTGRGPPSRDDARLAIAASINLRNAGRGSASAIAIRIKL